MTIDQKKVKEIFEEAGKEDSLSLEDFKVEDFIPSGYRMLIEPIPDKKQNPESRIQLLDSTKEKEKNNACVGRVIKMGPDCYDSMASKWCKEGDIVGYRRYDRIPFRIGNTDYFIINDEHVITTIKSEK